MPPSLLLALVAAAQPAPPLQSCSLIYPVAQDEAAAERIGRAVIDARPGPEFRAYFVDLRIDRDDPGTWIAVQTFPERRPILRRDQAARASRRRVEMRIDRCTGAISQLRFSRD